MSGVAACPDRVKLGGKGASSTRPIMPNDRTLPVLTALFRDVPLARPGHAISGHTVPTIAP